MSDLCRRPRRRRVRAAAWRTLWQLAAAFFEAQALGLLAADVYSKRVASRAAGAVAHERARRRPTVSDRLAQDLLFFCAQAARARRRARRAPRLRAVREAFGLAMPAPVDYNAAGSAASTRR